MTIHVHIPSSLRESTEQQSQVDVSAATVGAAMQQLVDSYPGLDGKLLSSSGELHSFVNVFVGDRNIRELQGLATGLSNGQTLLIVPALAGG